MSKLPNPPSHLSDAGKSLWASIMSDFVIGEAHHITILTRACEQADRLAAIRTLIAGGVTTELLAAERAATNLQRLLIRELNLDATTEVPRLPRGQRYGS